MRTAAQKPDSNSFPLDSREDLVVNAVEIFDTCRQALIVVDKELRVILANTSFYRTFQTTREVTEGKLIYDLGNGQWNIPKLKQLLEHILPEEQVVDDFEVEHNFEHIGPKAMLLNAREIIRQNNRQRVILIAIEDITAKKALEAHARAAESQINSILEQLIDSAERHSGGTAPNDVS